MKNNKKSLEQFGERFPELPIQTLALIYGAYEEGYIDGSMDEMQKELEWLDENFTPTNVTITKNH